MANTDHRIVLIVEKDIETADAILWLCEALGLTAEIAQTHKNAIRACATRPVGIIFLNPNMNMINPRALVEEIQALAARRNNGPAAPILFLVKTMEILEKSGLKGHPGTGAIAKPLQLEQVYVAFDKLGLVNLEAPEPADTMAGKIDGWQEFLSSAEVWMERIRDYLVPK